MAADRSPRSEPAAERSAAGRGPWAVLDALDAGVSAALIAAMAILVVVVTVQVMLRYIFNTSLDWAWETSRLAFVTVVFLGIPLGVKSASHVGIDLIHNFLPPAARRVLLVGLNLVVVFLMLVVTIVGFDAVRSTWDQTLSTIPISTGWFYVPVLWSGLHCSLHLIRQSIDLARGGQLPESVPQ